MPDTSHFHDSYSLGRVFSRAFELLKNNLAGVGVFMLILHLLMGLATYISTEASRNIMAMTLANPPPANPAANLQHLSAMLAAFEAPQYWLSPIAVFVVQLFFYAGATGGLLASGESLFGCMTTGLRKFLPMLALFILWILGISFGFMLLIMPGVFLLLMWAVVVPVLVGEDVGVFGSFGRSAALTKGNRATILATMIVLMVVNMVVGAVIQIPLQGQSVMTMFVPHANPLDALPHFSLFSAILSAEINGALSLFTLAILVSIYRELRAVKEGDSPDQLREIFS